MNFSLLFEHSVGRHGKLVAAALVIMLLLVPALLDAQDSGIRGQVRSGGNGEPLAGAVVEVMGGPGTRSTISGAGGAYHLGNVPSGRRLLRASHIGHATLEVEVLIPAGREVDLELVLPLKPVQLDPVHVAAGRPLNGADTVAALPADLSIAGARVMETTPGIAELGLGDAVRGVPGQEPADPSHILYVRGAAADLKLVHLDGAPVYAPFPLGGLLDAFTPELLSSADVYVGGAPARFDGGLSYVLDLRTRGASSGEVRSTGAVDLLSARTLLEVPITPGFGFLASGRSVHGLGAASPLPYGYTEGLVRTDLRLSDNAALSATGFHNREVVWMEATGAPDSSIAWGNRSASLRFSGVFRDTEIELTAARGDFDARLPLKGSRPILAEGGVNRTRLAADLSSHGERVNVWYGIAYDHQSQSYRGQRIDSASTHTPVWTEAVGAVAGAYVDAAWRPLERVRLRGGLRLDHFSLDGRISLAPRFSATWLLTERAALTLAGGRYHQYLRAPEAALLAASSATGVPGMSYGSALTIGHATHLTAGLDQDLGDGIRLGLEGYFKNYQGLPGISAAEANASGVDLWMRRSRGSVTGWAGYSLAWLWSVDSLQGNSFAGRHLLSAGASAPVGERNKVAFQLAYGAGLPYSTIPFTTQSDWASSPPPGNERFANASALSGSAPLLPAHERPYLRIDASAFRSWAPTLFGSQTQIASYVKVLNTLGRRDALFYQYDRATDDAPRPLAALPVVPVVGLEWRF
ncbi:TonB-dependent receptor [soil metagenome]